MPRRPRLLFRHVVSHSPGARAPRASLGSDDGEEIFASFDTKILMRFFAYVRPYKGTLILAMFGVLAISVPGSLGPTMRRLRWLLLTLLAAFAWTVPGEPLWPMAWAPTREGLLTGGEHALRLLALVCAIRLVLACSSRAEQLVALWTLARPMRYLGLRPERGVLLVGLALEEADAWLAQRRGWRELRAELSRPAAEDGAVRQLTLQCPHFHLRDGLVLAAAMAVLASLWMA